MSRLAQRMVASANQKDVFRREITEGKHFYSDLASRLVANAGDKDILNQLTRLGRQESTNIASMIEQIDPEVFVQTVELLASAHRVRIHGMRQFNSLELFMPYGLGMKSARMWRRSTPVARVWRMRLRNWMKAMYWWCPVASPTPPACFPLPRLRPVMGSRSSH